MAGVVYRKLTALYSFPEDEAAHALCMGTQAKKVLLGIVAAGLAFGASEGQEWTTKGLQLYREGHFAEAESMYRRALDAFDRAGEGGSLDRALTLENVAVMLRAEGRYTESEKVHREALPRLEELTGPDSLATVRAVGNLAALYWSSGKLEQAESLALRADTAFRNLPAATRSDRAANRQILASIFLTEHRYEDAENLLHDTLEDGDGANGVIAYSNMAVAALGVHDNAKAEEYARQAIELALRVLPFTSADRRGA